MAELLWHFSEERAIAEFTPRAGSPLAPAEALVWAIDQAHAPAYWFPRDCPRVTFWPPPGTDGRAGGSAGAGLLAGARRVHAIEWGWLDRMRSTALWAYGFDPAPFEPMDPAAGYLVSRHAVRPAVMEPVGDLLDRHAAAGIELRLAPSLWPLADAVVAAGLSYSLIRMGFARSR